ERSRCPPRARYEVRRGHARGSTGGTVAEFTLFARQRSNPLIPAARTADEIPGRETAPRLVQLAHEPASLSASGRVSGAVPGDTADPVRSLRQPGRPRAAADPRAFKGLAEYLITQRHWRAGSLAALIHNWTAAAAQAEAPCPPPAGRCQALGLRAATRSTIPS